tara:strand:- start:1932 stop:3479 length:1548 start_codon:yes stop_codon:yes gene_type:complete
MLRALQSSNRFRVKAVSIPAPVGGLNSRDSIDAMAPTDAIIMSNFFPTVEKVTLRDGFTQFCTGIGSGSVQTLIEHNAGANRQLLAIGSDGILYQIDTGSAVSKKTGLANGRAEHIEFNNVSVIVPSGANVPFSWNGSSASDLSITLSDSVNPNTLTGVHAHKNRVYYWTGTSQNFYYSATVDTFQGNFTKFPVGLVGTFGGNILSINSLSIDGGEGVDDLLAIIMTSGEVLIYSGSNPSSDFALVGTFRIAEPVNEKRGIAKLGGDVIVMTREGYLPLSQVVRQDLIGNKAQAISEKIRGTVISQVKLTGTSTGWQIFVSPDGDKVYFNYPTGDTNDPFNQHVFNPIIRAWCIFENMASHVWGQFNGDTFFGSSDGKVFKIGGDSDNDENIVGDLSTSYNYFNDRAGIKRFSSVQPMLEGLTDVDFSFGVGVDQKPPSTIEVAAVTFASNLATWDVATYDDFFWADSAGAGTTRRRKAINQLGYSAALRVKVATNTQTISFISAHYTFEQGGPL